MSRDLDGRYFVLDAEHNVVPVDTIDEWGAFFEKIDNRRVGFTEIDEHTHVSTVFLGLEHPGGIFETMVFRDRDNAGRDGGYMERCKTWDEAVAMHERVVAGLRNGSGDYDD